MGYIWEGVVQAFRLILSLDREVLEVVAVSLQVSCASTLLACMVGVPLGLVIGLRAFRGQAAVITVLQTLMALPTVVVGLTVYSFLSRRGPLGLLGLLYTPYAIVLGEFILILPIVTALTVSAVQAVDSRVQRTARTLGANDVQAALAVLREGRLGILASVMAGFGRVIAEVGCAMMLGGNIRGSTRTMTTAIALETSKGEFGFGLALGIVLIFLALSVNVGSQWLRRGR